MGIKGKVEKADWLDAEGSFTAKLTKLDEKSGEFSTVVQFTFEILDSPDHEGKEVSGITGLKVTPDNKTAKWIAALDPDFDFEIDKEFDFESLKGKVCRILVEEKESKGRTYCNVVKCRALKSEEQTSLKKTMESKPKAEEKKEEKKEKKTKTAADEDIDF